MKRSRYLYHPSLSVQTYRHSHPIQAISVNSRCTIRASHSKRRIPRRRWMSDLNSHTILIGPFVYLSTRIRPSNLGAIADCFRFRATLVADAFLLARCLSLRGSMESTSVRKRTDKTLTSGSGMLDLLGQVVVMCRLGRISRIQHEWISLLAVLRAAYQQ